MSKDNKIWTQFEDNALKELREDQGLTKWSLIAKKLAQDYKIEGKSAKRCRERYHNHVNSLMNKQSWTADEESLLVELHNQLGNRWVEIGRKLKRSDNAVKNHYHSKLRMALRRINRLLAEWLKGEFKPLKNNIISKIIQTAEDYYGKQNEDQPSPARLCFTLKNKVIQYLKKTQGKPTDEQITELRSTVREMNQFNKIYKKKNKLKSGGQKDSRRSHPYKAKEIRTLIHENHRQEHEEVQEIQEEEEGYSQSLQSQQEVPNVGLVDQTHANQLSSFRPVQPIFYYGTYNPVFLEPINFYQQPVTTTFYTFQQVPLLNYPNPNKQINWTTSATEMAADYNSLNTIHDTMPDFNILQHSGNEESILQ